MYHPGTDGDVIMPGAIYIGRDGAVITGAKQIDHTKCKINYEGWGR